MKRFSLVCLIAILGTLFLQPQASLGKALLSADAPNDLETPLPVAWSLAREYAGIAYFLIASPAQLRRYDMNNGIWLSNVSLDLNPVSFTVDSSGIYVAYEKSVSRLNPDGGNGTQIFQSVKTIRDLFVLDQFLYVVADYEVSSLNKNDGTVIDTEDYLIGSGFSMAPGIRRIYGLLKQSPVRWTEFSLEADGQISSHLERGPESQCYQSHTFVMPDERRVMDCSGGLYFSSDLSSAGQISRADDVVSYGMQIIAVANGGVTAYSSTFEKLGDYYPLEPAQKAFVHGSQIFTFYTGPQGISVTSFSASLLKLTGQESQISPNEGSYWPDWVEMDKNETVYLLNRDHLSIFRWSVPERKYLESIRLSQPPVEMAYSPATHRMYLLYNDGHITQIYLDEGLAELPFLSTSAIFHIQTAGKFLIRGVILGQI